jgi:hypothetical protein
VRRRLAAAGVMADDKGMRRLALVLFVAACGTNPTNPSTPDVSSVPETPTSEPPAAGSIVPGSSGPPTATKCSGPAPSPAHKCVQNCGPPVVQAGDPPPGFSWLSPDEQASRDNHGCPRCLPASAQIETPRGAMAVSELRIGDTVWTLDDGKRVERPLVAVTSTPVGAKHRLARVLLADGRHVSASPEHPVQGGKLIAELVVGQPLDGSTITRIDIVDYAGSHTFDLLPAGSTGTYWADGVLLQSTLVK